MDSSAELIFGLELILEELDRRYAFNGNGRLTHLRGEGILPQFVLGRAAEGCVWRFSAELSTALVNSVARLSGRESGFPIAGDSPASPPERLVMIERLLSKEGAEARARREPLSRSGIEIAELWTID
jgi:hypothetical protein